MPAARRLRILARIDRLAHGNPGDTRSIGPGVSELRLSLGPGYRIYYTQRGNLVALLLCGSAEDAISVPRALGVIARSGNMRSDTC